MIGFQKNSPALPRPASAEKGIKAAHTDSLSIRQKWLEFFAEANKSALYDQLRSTPLPESDWAGFSDQKVHDFIKSVLAAFRLLGEDRPFSTVETGVFAGGTSAVLLHVLGHRFKNCSVHIGIDPYFLTEQSYPELAETYGREPYLKALKDLSETACRLGVPYVPYLMGSNTVIRNDLLPGAYDFRLFHLDGDHSANAVLAELEYFSAKAAKPAVFILDDLGEGFPGVREALTSFQKSRARFIELREFRYNTRAGQIGFGVFYLDTEQ